MKLKVFMTIALAGALLVFYSCKKKNDNWASQTFPYALVSTSPVTLVTQASAKSGGKITSEGTSAITAVGVCWDTETMPTTLKPHTNNGAGVGTFDSQINGLKSNTKYYVRSYVTNASGTKYGEEVSFTTLPNWVTLVPNSVFGFFQVATIASNASAILMSSPNGSFAISRSTDNGVTFTDGSAGLPNGTFVNAMIAMGPNFFVGTNNGVFISTNNAGSWTPANTGLTGFVNSLAASGPNLFAGTFAGIFLSSNNGNSWTNVTTAINNPSVADIDVSGSRIFAGANTGLYLSSDNGSSWTEVGQGSLPTSNIVELFSSPTSIFSCHNSGFGIYKSTDNGNLFQPSNNGITAVTITSAIRKGNYLFVGTSNGAFLSADDGGTWSPVNSGLSNLSVTAIGEAGNSVLLGTNQGGLFRLDLPF